jgi:hypothetical protein
MMLYQLHLISATYNRRVNRSLTLCFARLKQGARLYNLVSGLKHANKPSFALNPRILLSPSPIIDSRGPNLHGNRQEQRQLPVLAGVIFMQPKQTNLPEREAHRLSVDRCSCGRAHVPIGKDGECYPQPRC